MLIVLLTSCGHQEENTKDETTYIVSFPIRKDTLVYKDYVCQIHSIQHIELRVLEKGYLQNIYVDEGQQVKKGDLLFQIMPVVYNAELQKSMAEVSFAEIEFLNAKALADSNVISKNELALSRAKLQKAKADLVLAKAQLNFTEIRAPFDGIVGLFNNVRKGSLLDEGAMLTTLSDNSILWVYYNVPEAEYLNYKSRKETKVPLKVKLELANNQLYELDGVVETIEADFNNETGNIAFRAKFLNPKGIIRHGETGKILMPVELKNALLIPQKATYDILDKKYVFVVDNNNQVQSKEIKVGVELPHLFVVTEGLNDRDRILIEGIRKVRNGMAIKYETKSQLQILNELSQLRAE